MHATIERWFSDEPIIPSLRPFTYIGKLLADLFIHNTPPPAFLSSFGFGRHTHKSKSIAHIKEKKLHLLLKAERNADATENV